MKLFISSIINNKKYQEELYLLKYYLHSFFQTPSRRVEQHSGRLRQQRGQTEAGSHLGPVGASRLLREDAGSVGESGSQVVPLQQGERQVSDSLQVRCRRGQVHRDVREGPGDRWRERTRRRKIRLLARWFATVLLQHHRGRAQVLGAGKV